MINLKGYYSHIRNRYIFDIFYHAYSRIKLQGPSWSLPIYTLTEVYGYMRNI